MSNDQLSDPAHQTPRLQVLAHGHQRDGRARCSGAW